MRQAPGAVLKRLGEWQKAGLITADAAGKIADYEAKRRRPALLYAVFGLGGFAVVVGMIAIIAANWAYISGGTKIGIDLALCALLAYRVVRPLGGEEGFGRETAIIILFGMTLASIGLIAQVYNLGGKPYQALLTWLVLTTALVFHGRGTLLATLWGIGSTATAAFWVTDFLKLSHAGERTEMEISFIAAAFVPLGLIVLGELGVLARGKALFARAFRGLGWAEVLTAALSSQLLWYVDTTYKNTERPWIGLTLATVAYLAFAFVKPRERSQQALIVFMLVSAVLPIFIPHGKESWLAALSFIGLWILVAWDAYGEGNSALLNLSTGMIALRIVIVYIEVFGTLLSTGLSLLTGGLLTIGLAAVWVRQSRKFREELG